MVNSLSLLKNEGVSICSYMSYCKGQHLRWLSRSCRDKVSRNFESVTGISLNSGSDIVLTGYWSGLNLDGAAWTDLAMFYIVRHCQC
jgi:hypothetical protein